MPVIQMPDGTQVQFPDDMPDDQIRGLILQKFPDAAQRAQPAPAMASPKGNFQPLGATLHGQTPDDQMVEYGRPNAVESALFGAADFGSFGTWDEITAAIDSMLGGDYDRTLEHARNRLKTAQIEHPYAYTGGQVLGAVPMAMSGLGAVREGMGLTGKAIASGLVGAGQGAAYGYGSGEGGPAQRMVEGGKDAAFGGLVSGAVPVVGNVIGKIAQALRQARIPVKADPSLILGKALDREGLTPANANAVLDDLGPEAMLLDAGLNLREMAGGIAATPGNAQKQLADAILARKNAANSRIIGDVDNILGPASTPSRVDADIVANQRTLGPSYDTLLEGAQAVDTSNIANRLDAAIVNLRGPAQSAVKKVRDMLNVYGEDVLDPNPATLHHTREAIDGLMETETNSKVVQVLTDARKRIDELLADNVPGIKDIDAQYAELAKQSEALTAGQQVLDSGRTAIRPSELIDQVLQAGDPRLMGPSGVPFRLSQGARAEIDRLIGTTANDVNALRSALKGDGSWNRQRLATLFGQDKADALIRILDREATYATTANDVLGKSPTAARLSVQKDLGIGAGSEKPAGVIQSALDINLGTAGRAAIEKVTAGLSAARKEQVMSELAGMLTAQGPERAAAIQKVAKALAASKAGSAAERITTGILTPFARVLAPQLLDMQGH
jgi:hypothetical protein